LTVGICVDVKDACGGKPLRGELSKLSLGELTRGKVGDFQGNVEGGGVSRSDCQRERAVLLRVESADAVKSWTGNG
jgi:hypothetical protein